MTTTKILGITSGVTINGTDYQFSKVTFKHSQEKIEYIYMGGGGWKRRFPGGAMDATGSFEAAADTTTQTGTYIEPQNGQLVPFAIPVGTKTLSFNAVIDDVEVEKNATGLVMVKGNYSSDGAVTYS